MSAAFAIRPLIEIRAPVVVFRDQFEDARID
jgi:hypothetical protein